MHSKEEQEGKIVGAINICRNVTERWKLGQCTQTALHALLAMAEALVQLPLRSGELNAPAGGKESPASAVTYLVGQRLKDKDQLSSSPWPFVRQPQAQDT